VLEQGVGARFVTRTSRSFSCENSVPLKSFQKSPTVLVRSSSAALTVKLRFAWPASLPESPPARAQTAMLPLTRKRVNLDRRGAARRSYVDDRRAFWASSASRFRYDSPSMVKISA
jgi:hypothetical protein